MARTSTPEPAVITGSLASFPAGDDVPEFKGSIIIEWPVAAAPRTPGMQSILPGILTTVRDVEDEKVIPFSTLALRVQSGTFIVADVAVFLDNSGAIIRDPSAIWRDSDGMPATFPFLVEEMRIGRSAPD